MAFKKNLNHHIYGIDQNLHGFEISRLWVRVPMGAPNIVVIPPMTAIYGGNFGSPENRVQLGAICREYYKKFIQERIFT